MNKRKIIRRLETLISKTEELDRLSQELGIDIPRVNLTNYTQELMLAYTELRYDKG